MFTLNLFDVVSVVLTFLVIFLVQILNVYLHILDDNADNGKSIDVVDKAPAKECPLLESQSPSSPIATTLPKSQASSNGKLEKQISLLDSDR